MADTLNTRPTRRQRVCAGRGLGRLRKLMTVLKVEITVWLERKKVETECCVWLF